MTTGVTTSAKPKVVVTGIGAAAPNGVGTHDYWSATRVGRNAIGRVTRFDPTPYPARLAGEITGFTAADHLPSRLLPQTDRMTRIALAAADWALTDAKADPASFDAYEMGVITASSSGGFEFGQNELRKLWSMGSQHVSAYQSFAWFYAVNSGQISIRNGMKGPSGVVVSDQAGGLDALAQARRQIRKGTPLILSGSIDAPICPWGWVAQLAGGRLSTVEDPERAFVPFDPDAAGHVPGEGGAILVMEDAERAVERGARAYGELAGYGATFDPAPGSGREPGLRRAAELAMADAGVAADEVDVVFADAAGVPELDRVEAEVITGLFGPRGVPVTAPKTMIGRLCSGAAPLDVATALLAIEEGLIPPTTNTSPDPGLGLDLVLHQPRPASVRTALVLARGHGGFNSAVVVRGTD
ncbi:Polyketide chain length factor WhiE-CLF [Actinokineospora spheciospongiae]|uniref:Polyketide chain length factor WhiE-CLF n=1 Tax=Actinokineospora spheciospongiae TaxID=909613 RepID=W7J1X5_9PSEU|nr:ketosynthase chain-length factor [Actinokineospora spheciospongiae]EWC62971.1 Polyketide chain length factor WhiE-CLF [Actinokineospora spheciospongiae]PWW60458.1 act minimal PKS chain-length factor (CLF/KS beta) [Actinokineospora spheciospongiae]